MNSREKPIASLSLDLDNLWSYLKTHGEKGWEAYPSYLDTLLPLTLDILRDHGLAITYFIVGQDAVVPENRDLLRQIADAGHEVGNHSFNHEPWLLQHDESRLVDEIGRAHEAIVEASGCEPVGFRGPGFSHSPGMLQLLARMNYGFDASILPSVLGPAARLYYFATSSMSRAERDMRRELFGRFSDGFQPLKPFSWDTEAGPLLEIPVTTVPLTRTPFHLSYLLWLSRFSRRSAIAYFEAALAMCRATGVHPSLLLHPLDFLGKEDAPQLAFFPAMDLARDEKVAFANDILHRYKRVFRVVPMGIHARQLAEGRPLPLLPVTS